MEDEKTRGSFLKSGNNFLTNIYFWELIGTNAKKSPLDSKWNDCALGGQDDGGAAADGAGRDPGAATEERARGHS